MRDRDLALLALLVVGAKLIMDALKRPLDFAHEQLGVTETGENGGVPLTRYGLSGETAAAWCARFIRWLFIMAGKPLPGRPYDLGSVTYMRQQLEDAGAWLGLTSDIRPGDILFLNERGLSDAPGSSGGRHVGLVVAEDADHVWTIDGNWANAVRQVRRRKDDPAIWGYARW